MLEINEVTPKIYHLNFDTIESLNLHFLRFCDYYESAKPEFYRQRFNFMASLKAGFSEEKDALTWNEGINLPIKTIIEMANDVYGGLTPEEEFIVAVVNNILRTQSAATYIIGTFGGKDITFYHELAHSFYHTDEAYKRRMESLIQTLPKRVISHLYDYLTRLQYHTSVQHDELQAYMATGFMPEEKPILDLALVNKYRAKFFDVFFATLIKIGG